MKQLFIASFLLLALQGCSTEPVRLVDYENQPIRRLNNHGISMEEVQIDIRMAAMRKGWNVASGETPGKMRATKIDGKASATVDIFFNLNSYNIKYKDSTGLDRQDRCSSKAPDGSVKIEGRCISPTYNEWLSELNKEISGNMQY